MDQRVTIWVVDLDSTAHDCARAWPLLDAGERARAQCLSREHDRKRFILRRAALREILARHTGLAPHALSFSHNAFERPFLAGSGLDFNTSHSDGLAVIAVTRHGRIGIDVERRLAEEPDPAILQPHLSPAAYATFLQYAPVQRRQAFYAWWTRVEAFAKARGTGIVMQPPPPLDGHADDTHPCVQPDEHGQPRTWHPTPLTLSPHHAATLVTSAPPRPLHIKTWE